MERPTNNCEQVCIQVAVELLEPLGDYFERADEETSFLLYLAAALKKTSDAFQIALALNAKWEMSEYFVVDLMKLDVYAIRRRVYRELFQYWLGIHAPKPSLKVGDSLRRVYARTVTRYDRLKNTMIIRSVDHEHALYVCNEGVIQWELADEGFMVL